MTTSARVEAIANYFDIMLAQFGGVYCDPLERIAAAYRQANELVETDPLTVVAQKMRDALAEAANVIVEVGGEEDAVRWRSIIAAFDALEKGNEDG